MQAQVFKFGGASIKDAKAIKNVGSIIQKFSANQLIVVLSALGKTTNLLEQILHAKIADNPIWKRILSELKQSHYNILEQLALDETLLDNHFYELEKQFEKADKEQYDFYYDQTVSYGEMLSSSIMAAYLEKINLPIELLDARKIINTDDHYRDANVQLHLTQKNIHDAVKSRLNKKQIVLTQGFIGGTKNGFTTTLGREGSDYTAAIISHCIHAANMTIWKDVEGVMNADPKQFADAQIIKQLSYYEAIEMTYFGAKVIHPKTIKPLQNLNIPLIVRSFENTENIGTTISSTHLNIDYPPLIVLKENQSLISIQTRDFSFISEKHLQHIFTVFADFRVHQNLMQNGAISFSCCIDNNSRLEEGFVKLRKEFKILVNENLQLLTIRHYNDSIIQQLTEGKTILLEQKSRNTIQLVLQ